MNKRELIPSWITSFPMFIGITFGSFYVGPFVHEMGHAIAGKCMGWKILCVKIYPGGSGRCMMMHFQKSSFRKRMIVDLSGPGLALACCGVYFSTQTRLRSDFFDYLILYHVCTNMLNVLPCKELTDGKRIWTYLTAKLGIKPRRYRISYGKAVSCACIIAYMGIKLLD